MTLNVSPECAEIILKAVASDAFGSPEEAVRYALRLLEREQHTRAESPANQPGYVSSRTDLLPDDLNPHDVARMQRVGPIRNPDYGAAGNWPPDESIDEWLADLQELRGQGMVRKLL